MEKPNPEGESYEAQLAALQKEFRYMEVDRKTYGELSQNLIRKQRATIERWKTENEHIKAELLAIESRQHAAETDVALTTRLGELSELKDKYQMDTDAEKDRIVEVERQIKLVNSRIKELKAERKSLGFTVNAAVEDDQLVSKEITVLENRLEKALIKFNEALSKNKALRQEIDNLRTERVVFDDIYRKLDDKQKTRKSEMKKIIDLSQQYYNERDADQETMNKAKEAHIHEMQVLEQEIMEINRKLRFDRRLKNFVGLKETDRVGQHRTQSGVRKKEGKGFGSKTKSNSDQLGEKLRKYQDVFDKIQSATGITDTDELVRTFREVEDQNFSLFNFVNDLQTEIEKSEGRTAALRNEIASLEANVVHKDASRKTALQRLAKELEETEAQGAQYEAKYNSALKMVNQLKGAVMSLFKTAACDASSIVNNLGDVGISEANIMDYLCLIEQRISEIVVAHVALLVQQGDDKTDLAASAGTTKESTVRRDFEPAQITFAEADDDDGTFSDDAEPPLTREAVLKKYQEDLAAAAAQAEDKRRGGRTATGSTRRGGGRRTGH